ncbi:hypothetical protein BDW71DRAFT_188116 [Aspergillus fruticulosus]
MLVLSLRWKGPIEGSEIQVDTQCTSPEDPAGKRAGELSNNEEPKRRDIEKHEFVVPRDEQTVVTIELSISDFPCRCWVDHIEAQCTLGGDQMEYANGMLVYRDLVSHEFWVRVNPLNRETAEIAFALCDRYGTLDR